MAGGAMVLVGLAAGPALLVMGLVAGKAADKNLDQAKINRLISISKELEPGATIKKYLIVQNEGDRQIKRETNHYNLPGVGTRHLT